MGRKDLTAERQALILDAAERCIVRYGLQGMTLEQIADEAGINRGLIHHYVGNREDLLQLMMERLLERYQDSFDAFAANHPTSKETLIDYYFASWFELAPDDDAIIVALLAESERDLQIREMLWSLYARFENTIYTEIARLFPHTPEEKLHEAAYSVMLLAFSHATLTWLRLPRAIQTDVRTTAANLLQTLS